MTAPRVAACALAGILCAPIAARAQAHLGLEAGSFAGDSNVLEYFRGSEFGSATVLGARLGYVFPLGAGHGFGLDVGWRSFQGDVSDGAHTLGKLRVMPITLGLFYSARPTAGRGLGGRIGMGIGANLGRFEKGRYLDSLAPATTVQFQNTGKTDLALEIPMALEYFATPWLSLGLQLRLGVYRGLSIWQVDGTSGLPKNEYGIHPSYHYIRLARHDVGFVCRLWLP